MKLRYYLRGIGIGIIVAAAICICASIGKKGMTDAEVKARAKELGMSENSTLLVDVSDEFTTTTEEAESEVTDEIVTLEVVSEEAVSESEEPNILADVEEKVVEEVAESTPEPTKEPEPTKAPEPTKEPEPTKAPEPAKEPQKPVQTGESYVIITVDKGNGSDTVAKKIADAGLVADAAAYDKYLCANGYDRRIRAGVHEVPKDATEEQIAKLLCGMN